MSAARLILLLLLVLVAVVIVLFVLRRGAARRDAQRVEAAGLRSDADALATTVAGQTAYADQAAQRAEIARVEAEDKAREAARLEEEATEHRATVEASQRDYETTMRRADDIDPDVKESAFAPVADADDADDAGDADADAGAADAGDADADPGAADAVDSEGETMMTRAARREAREAEQEGGTGSGYSAPSAASSAATAGAAGGAAAGAAAWASRGDDESGDESERIASAADFRDDVPDEPVEVAEPDEPAEAAEPDDADDDVYAAPDTGSDADMSDDTRTETSEPAQHDDGLDAGGAAAAASADSGGAYAATRALHEQHDREAAESSEPDADVAHDVESPRGEWGGPHDDGAASHDDAETAAKATETSRDQAGADADAADVDRTDGSHDTDAAGMTVITDPESYAATEPVLAEDQTPPVSPQDTGSDEPSADEPASDDHVDADEHAHDQGDDHAPAEAGAAVAETDDTDRSAADVAEHSTEERYDPTPTRDWSADEGELLEETHDRGERLEEERSELAQSSDDAAGVAAAELADHGDEVTEPTDTAVESSDAQEAADDDGEATASDETADATTVEQPGGRRISGFDELRDGGFGVGSAAPLDDGAQPLDHPVQAYRDTMTYRAPGDPGYDSAEPHVWFYDEDAAQRSGFRRAEG